MKDLNVRTRSINLLKQNRGVNLHNLGFGKGFLNMTPKAQATNGKNRQNGLHQNKKFCVTKDAIKKMKRLLQSERKYLQIYT